MSTKLNFTETDHRHWDSDLLGADEMPVFTIDTAYRNKYLPAIDRPKNPVYLLSMWDNGNLIFAQSFRSLKESIQHAKSITL